MAAKDSTHTHPYVCTNYGINVPNVGKNSLCQSMAIILAIDNTCTSILRIHALVYYIIAIRNAILHYLRALGALSQARFP